MSDLEQSTATTGSIAYSGLLGRPPERHAYVDANAIIAENE